MDPSWYDYDSCGPTIILVVVLGAVLAYGVIA